MSRGPSKIIDRGIYRDQTGYRVTVEVSPLPQREKRYPPTATLKEMKAWQEETRVSLRLLAPDSYRGTLAADVVDYLAKVKPTHIDDRAFKQKERDIQTWVPRFGKRARATITAAELNAQLWEWRKEGYSAQTCNLRRTALGHLYVVLDGRSAKNPVRDTVKFEKPDPVPKALPLDLIDRVLAQLPNESRTQARLRLMRWTGMRPSQMNRLTTESFHLTAHPPHVVVPRGKKGRVVRIPFVSTAARSAAKAFVRICLERDAQRGKSIGRISTESANRLLADACRSIEVEPFTLYRIKHSVGSRLRQVMDLADLKNVFGHTDAHTTEIYAPPVEEKIVAGFKHLTVRQAKRRSARARIRARKRRRKVA